MPDERSFYTKSPAEVLDYEWDWGPWLKGETLVDHDLEFVDHPDAALSYDQDPEQNGNVVTMWLKGGTDGKSYRVRATATSSSGAIGVRTSTFFVRATR